MKRTILVILCAIFASTVAFAQGKPVAKFEKTTHDYGQVSEEDGNVSYKFVFTNEGDAPLVITNVTASCGCTTPEWTKEPIAPKTKGSVTVTYGAKGRPGPISRTVSVYTNQGDAPIVLSIKGNVSPKPLTPEEKFPVEMGNLRLKDLTLNYGNITIGGQKVQILDVYNAGTTALTLKYEKLPKYITVKTEPASIPAKTEGKLIVIFNSAVAKEYGRFTGSFGLLVNNSKPVSNQLGYTATVLDDLKNTDPATAPKLGMSASFLNFGPMSEPGAKAVQEIKISNSGKSDLLIRKISSGNPEITASSSKFVVKPGEIVDVKVAVSKKIKEVTNATLTIITNDPFNTVNDMRVTIRP
ncbi:MAG: DUF1573 domain-containing protein [Dysgonamonadaceae bacterium]|jgi:hypothetical protein|nr:DUF1573 domain-containing protein [Dysgonamonadaceae bacterium]